MLDVRLRCLRNAKRTVLNGSQAVSYTHLEVISRIASIGSVEDVTPLTVSTADKPFPVVDDAVGETMRAEIAAAKAEGDSVGGIVECAVLGLPVGLGGPLFDRCV